MSNASQPNQPTAAQAARAAVRQDHNKKYTPELRRERDERARRRS